MTEQLNRLFKQVDVLLTNWMARYSVVILRVSLGVVFVWFGGLKYFPGLSPAEDLAARTVETLTFGLVGASLSMPMLATLEVMIGLGLVFGVFMRATLLLLLFQMIGAVMPVFLFPDEVFKHFPYALTLEGQYIVKNMVLVSAGLVIGALVRGGAVVADPDELATLTDQQVTTHDEITRQQYREA